MQYVVSRRAFLAGAMATAAAGWLGGAATSRPVSAAPASHADLTKLRVAFWSQPIAEQANVFAAQERGWFAEAGLDFEFLPGAGGGDALKNLVAGNADIAFTNLEPVFFALDQGSPLKAVYNIYPENVFNVTAPKDRGITRPEDLKGRKVGIYSRASGTYHNLLVLLRSVGLKEADVEVVAAGVNNFGPLLQGQVDAQATTDTGLVLAQRQGLGDADTIWVKNYLNTPADAYVVTEAAYRDRQDVIRRFLDVYRRATRWTIENPQPAAEIAQKYAVDGDDVARNLEIVKLRNLSSVNDDTRAHGLGWFNLDTLRRVEEALFELGLTTNRIKVEEVFTNDLVAAG